MAHGKTRQPVPDGHPRRMSDARTAIKKMSTEQLRQLRQWMRDSGYLPDEGKEAQ